MEESCSEVPCSVPSCWSALAGTHVLMKHRCCGSFSLFQCICCLAGRSCQWSSSHRKSWMVPLYCINRLPPKISCPTGTWRDQWPRWGSEQLLSSFPKQLCAQWSCCWSGVRVGEAPAPRSACLAVLQTDTCPLQLHVCPPGPCCRGVAALALRALEPGRPHLFPPVLSQLFFVICPVSLKDNLTQVTG